MRLHDVLDYQARERPSAEFAVQGNRRLTYREALLEVHQLTHRAVTAHLAQATLVLGPRAGERCLLVVPLYHAAGAFASFLAVW